MASIPFVNDARPKNLGDGLEKALFLAASCEAASEVQLSIVAGLPVPFQLPPELLARLDLLADQHGLFGAP